jgi:protein-S-isoprenylcysteine O-methyltransferase Ste14
MLVQTDHELIVRGPYRYVRHPMYSGLLMMIIGGALFLARPGGAIVVLALLAFFRMLVVPKEEAVLMKHFPDDYPAYKRKVKALVPFVF